MTDHTWDRPSPLNWKCTKCGKETDHIVQLPTGDVCKECDK